MDKPPIPHRKNSRDKASGAYPKIFKFFLIRAAPKAACLPAGKEECGERVP
jgi:hypothetical protein